MAPLGRSAQVGLMSKSRANYKLVVCDIINNGSMGRCFSDRPAQLHSISSSIFPFSEQDLLIWLCPILIVAHRVFVASRGIFRRGTGALVVARELQSMWASETVA